MSRGVSNIADGALTSCDVRYSVASLQEFKRFTIRSALGRTHLPERNPPKIVAVSDQSPQCASQVPSPMSSENGKPLNFDTMSWKKANHERPFSRHDLELDPKPQVSSASPQLGRFYHCSWASQLAVDRFAYCRLIC